MVEAKTHVADLIKVWILFHQMEIRNAIVFLKHSKHYYY